MTITKSLINDLQRSLELLANAYECLHLSDYYYRKVIEQQENYRDPLLDIRKQAHRFHELKDDIKAYEALLNGYKDILRDKGE